MEEAKTKYMQQRTRARGRGIQWDLTFEQWYEWWQATGHWDERGKGHGKYVMCRIGDAGPYAIDNIYCASDLHNSVEGNLPKAIAVNTPCGRLRSQTEAAKVYKVNINTIKKWARLSRNGFSYVQ